MNKYTNIYNKSIEIYDYLCDIRRRIHRNPELSFQEFNTSKLIADELTKFNIKHSIVCETGVIAEIGEGENCIALRADIDALPITEETGCSFASENHGIMHACGHDMHATMLLGAARILKDIEENINSKILFVFQPGEEKLPGGALKLIEAGALDNPKPSAIFGQHVNPSEYCGTLSLASGKIMASADELYWTVRGKGSHAAQPHMGSDPINASANMVAQMQTIINKLRNPLESAVLSVTSIHGGTATNIIPEEVKMMGTLRTFNNDWRIFILDRIEKLCTNLASDYGCECKFEPIIGYPPLVNSEDLTSLVNTVAKKFNDIKVIDFEPKMWAEDFAYYYQKAEIPCCFWFIGAKQKGDNTDYGLHHPKFLPAEETMIYGTTLLSAVALEALNII